MVAFSAAGGRCCRAGSLSSLPGCHSLAPLCCILHEKKLQPPSPTMSAVQGGVHMTNVDKIEDLAKQMLGGTLVTKQTGAAGECSSLAVLCCH